eukprot:2147199-Rhodomonas_salina.3
MERSSRTVLESGSASTCECMRCRDLSSRVPCMQVDMARLYGRDTMLRSLVWLEETSRCLP